MIISVYNSQQKIETYLYNGSFLHDRVASSTCGPELQKYVLETMLSPSSSSSRFLFSIANEIEMQFLIQFNIQSIYLSFLDDDTRSIELPWPLLHGSFHHQKQQRQPLAPDPSSSALQNS